MCLYTSLWSNGWFYTETEIKRKYWKRLTLRATVAKPPRSHFIAIFFTQVISTFQTHNTRMDREP